MNTLVCGRPARSPADACGSCPAAVRPVARPPDRLQAGVSWVEGCSGCRYHPGYLSAARLLRVPASLGRRWSGEGEQCRREEDQRDGRGMRDGCGWQRQGLSGPERRASRWASSSASARVSPVPTAKRPRPMRCAARRCRRCCRRRCRRAWGCPAPALVHWTRSPDQVVLSWPGCPAAACWAGRGLDLPRGLELTSARSPADTASVPGGVEHARSTPNDAGDSEHPLGSADGCRRPSGSARWRPRRRHHCHHGA